MPSQFLSEFYIYVRLMLHLKTQKLKVHII